MIGHPSSDDESFPGYQNVAYLDGHVADDSGSDSFPDTIWSDPSYFAGASGFWWGAHSKAIDTLDGPYIFKP